MGQVLDRARQGAPGVQPPARRGFRQPTRAAVHRPVPLGVRRPAPAAARRPEGLARLLRHGRVGGAAPPADAAAHRTRGRHPHHPHHRLASRRLGRARLARVGPPRRAAQAEHRSRGAGPRPSAVRHRRRGRPAARRGRPAQDLAQRLLGHAAGRPPELPGRGHADRRRREHQRLRARVGRRRLHLPLPHDGRRGVRLRPPPGLPRRQPVRHGPEVRRRHPRHRRSRLPAALASRERSRCHPGARPGRRPLRSAWARGHRGGQLGAAHRGQRGQAGQQQQDHG